MSSDDPEHPQVKKRKLQHDDPSNHTHLDNGDDHETSLSDSSMEAEPKSTAATTATAEGSSTRLRHTSSSSSSSTAAAAAANGNNGNAGNNGVQGQNQKGRERGLLQDPASEGYDFSGSDSIPTGGLFPRKYFKNLHRGSEVFSKGDVVSIDMKDATSDGGEEEYAQILCFFLNHKRFMQMQIRWLRPVAFSMVDKTRRGNPLPISFTNSSIEKHPQPVEIIVEKIPWEKVEGGVAAAATWEKERKDTFKKKRKDKAAQNGRDDSGGKRSPFTFGGEIYSFTGENIFLNPFDLDIDVGKSIPPFPFSFFLFFPFSFFLLFFPFSFFFLFLLRRPGVMANHLRRSPSTWPSALREDLTWGRRRLSTRTSTSLWSCPSSRRSPSPTLISPS